MFAQEEWTASSVVDEFTGTTAFIAESPLATVTLDKPYGVVSAVVEYRCEEESSQDLLGMKFSVSPNLAGGLTQDG